MLPREKRVPGAEIHALRHFLLARSAYFVLYGRPNGRRGSRFAIVVGAKTAKSAVSRHRLKRRAAAILGKAGKDRDMDLVIAILPPTTSLSAVEFQNALHNIFSSFSQ